MATFCVEIADESVGRVITAMCANYGYQAMISNPNWTPAEPVDPVTNPEELPIAREIIEEIREER